MNNTDRQGRLKLAIVGSGKIAGIHARHWQRVSEAQLVAVATHDETSARGLPGADAVAVYPSLTHLLADKSCPVDTIDICTPTPTHKLLALEAIRAGKNVLLEKPMARNTADCDEIIAAAKDAGTVVMVAHVLRYFPEFRHAHEQVLAGAVGTPAAVRTARLSGHPKNSWADWYADPELSGGVIMDLIIHDFDWLRWTFGPVDRVFAKGLYGQAEHLGSLDYALCTFHHASGVLTHVTGSWAHPAQFRTTFEICGDAGMLEYDSAKTSPLKTQLRSDAGSARSSISENPLDPAEDPFYREIRHFADCVITGKQPDITLKDAREAVRIAEAALESIRTGSVVTLERLPKTTYHANLSKHVGHAIWKLCGSPLQ